MHYVASSCLYLYARTLVICWGKRNCCTVDYCRGGGGGGAKEREVQEYNTLFTYNKIQKGQARLKKSEEES